MSIVYILMTIVPFFLLSKLLNKATSPLASPLLLSIIVLISIFILMGLDHREYLKANEPLILLLEPAIVALAIPLFTQIKYIRKHIFSVLVGCFIGVVTSLSSGLVLAKMLIPNNALVLSILPKSVTSPVAISISESIGGIASLTASLVILVGIFGAVLGFKILDICKITHPRAQGLAIGCGSHAIGAAAAIFKGDLQGAFSSVALIISAIMTALITPVISIIFQVFSG